MNRTLILAIFASLCFGASAQTNLLVITSPAGDYIGQGQTHVTTDAATFSVAGNAGRVTVTTPFGYWVTLDASGDGPLLAGTYSGAVRFPFNGNLPGIDVSGNGRGCNTIAGSFEIKEIGFGEDGSPNRLWATFSQSCEQVGPLLTGEVRYRSQTAPLPAPRTIRVPADSPTIQQAIDAAGFVGDTVLVSPGTYQEALYFKGKAVLVRSETSAAETIIDAPGDQACATFAAAETTNSVLRGFTLRDARIGVNIENASPLIEGNVIVDCVDGLTVWSSSPLIRSNFIARCSRTGAFCLDNYYPVFERNTIENCAAGIWMKGAVSIIRENVIRRNADYGVHLTGLSEADLIQNIVYGNGGSAVSWDIAAGVRGPLLLHNTLVGKTDGTQAAVSANGWDGRGRLVNNVIVGRPALYLSPGGDGAPPVAEYNLFYSPGGPSVTGSTPQYATNAHNITADPLFLDAESGDFRLVAQSPGIESARPDTFLPTDFSGVNRPVDGDGTGGALPDIGAFEYVPGPPRASISLSAVSDENQTELSWHPFDGATNYLVARGTNLAGPFTVFLSTTSTNGADTNIVPGQVYYYVIAGENRLGTGAYSSPVRLKAGNRSPIARSDSFILMEDTPGEFSPLANDSEPDDDPMGIELLAPYPEGLSLTASNTIIYQPPVNFSGTNSFGYRAYDDRGRSSTNQVTLVVLPVNDPPAVGDRFFSVRADSAGLFNLNISDPDSSEFELLLTWPPIHGFVQVFSGSNFLYQPARGFIGTDVFRYRVSDGVSASAEVEATVVVNAPVDLDRDGMPDIWETLWDLNNPAADPDLDGLPNGSEYLAGTSPRDPNSTLRIMRQEITVDGRIALSWQATGGTRYRIYSADGSPLVGSFLPLTQAAASEIETAPFGATTVRTFIDPRPLARVRFYRIAVVQ